MIRRGWISFEVVGDPAPQGTLRSFERGGRVVTATSNAGALSRWRADVRAAFERAAEGRAGVPLAGPVGVTVEFRLRRPRSHYWAVNLRRPTPVLRGDAPYWHVGRPDVDKLLRAILDALTLLAYVGDEQVCDVHARKVYAERPGAAVVVAEVDDRPTG